MLQHKSRSLLLGLQFARHVDPIIIEKQSILVILRMKTIRLMRATERKNFLRH